MLSQEKREDFLTQGKSRGVCAFVNVCVRACMHAFVMKVGNIESVCVRVCLALWLQYSQYLGVGEDCKDGEIEEEEEEGKKSKK